MTTFKRLVAYLRYEWRIYLLGFLLLLVSVGLSVYLPTLGKLMIDTISRAVRHKQAINQSDLIRLFAYYVGGVCLSAGLGYLASYLLGVGSNRVSKILRDQTHEHMQKLPISYFDNKPAGKIAARIVNDTESLRQNFYHNFTAQALLNAIQVIGIYLATCWVSLPVGFGLTALIPLLILWQYIYTKKATPLNNLFRETVSELNSQTAEIVQGVAIVQAFNQEEAIYDDFQTQNQIWMQTGIKKLQLDSPLSWEFADLLEHIVMFCLLLYIGIQYDQVKMVYSAGTLFVLMNYISRLFGPLAMLVRQFALFQLAMTSGQRVLELLDQPIEDQSGKELEVSKGKVAFEGVHFAYEKGHPVLKDIHFSVDQGQTVGLVGHTGSGKSSIINLLFRFYDAQEGQILIDGQDIQACQRASVRQQMGIVLQEPYLFTGTVASNVHMNDPAISDQMVEEALIKVGAGPMLAKFEKGIHEPVIEKGQSLSSGERQLISFARALASQPKILILDEATSHIDTETEEVIQQAMNIVKEGRTTFIVAHRLSTIQAADLILVLDKGEIVERGNHESLMALNGQYAQMYRLQAKVSQASA
ncbi:ABC transporter ATP-binding protein [Vaginisenegalia massiliensis]|uniref:ABC transporter ATP-binding protein n=1 Tax=Vaginisenegalia massiliensis TaxID=2058294 RepID=UPI000F549663|nr:ABC transporter ATP-binding protein [Vaginisenegalia massiliensis]